MGEKHKGKSLLTLQTISGKIKDAHKRTHIICGLQFSLELQISFSHVVCHFGILDSFEVALCCDS